ncbi:hypothetical protein PoB_003259000 [Plakobranchus ocellatus]|uniref:Uncharacterized protein n=1 Tax=Plakobranchus ocellatus TaxID=259542 RepID=A0AAV4AD49_9GAST|nr:hypothetical protein PoB_003259000 [Plakobranchus ocellatus]
MSLTPEESKVQCESFSSVLESSDGLYPSPGWEYYRRMFAGPQCTQCTRDSPPSHKGAPTLVLLPNRQPTQPAGKDTLRKKVLAGSKVVINLLNSRGRLITRIPDTYSVNTTDGEITFRMPFDVIFSESSDQLEVSYLSVKTTGEVEEISFVLSNGIASPIVKNTHGQDHFIFLTQEVTCNHEFTWQENSDQSNSTSHCLAKFASHGAGFSVIVLKDEDSITRISKPDSVIVSNTGSRLMAVLRPQYYISYATPDALSVSSITREIQLVNWDCYEDSWTKEEMGTFSKKSVRLREPPVWFADIYWEEIYSINAEGKVLTTDTPLSSVYTAVTTGYHMKIGVLIHFESTASSWHILDAHTLRCVRSTQVCEAYTVSQLSTENPGILEEQGIKVTENKMETVYLRSPVEVQTTHHHVKWFREQTTVSQVFRMNQRDTYVDTSGIDLGVAMGMPFTLVYVTSQAVFAHRIEYISKKNSRVIVLRTGLTMVERDGSPTHGTCSFSQAPQYMLTATLHAGVQPPTARLQFSSWSFDMQTVCHKGTQVPFTAIEDIGGGARTRDRKVSSDLWPGSVAHCATNAPKNRYTSIDFLVDGRPRSSQRDEHLKSSGRELEVFTTDLLQIKRPAVERYLNCGLISTRVQGDGQREVRTVGVATRALLVPSSLPDHDQGSLQGDNVEAIPRDLLDTKHESSYACDPDYGERGAFEHGLDESNCQEGWKGWIDERKKLEK